jgi:hypothetical protein
MQIFGFSALKARRIHAHGIGSNREERDQIVSGIIRLPVPSQAGFLKRSDYGCSRDSRSGFIEHIAGETSSGLAMQVRREDECENADNHEKWYVVGFCIGRVFHRSRALRAKHRAFHSQTPFDTSPEVALASAALH